MDEQVKKFINDYLDSMPTRSRVTMYELAAHVYESTSFNRKAAYEIVREVLSSRQDFHVYRGMGACKL